MTRATRAELAELHFLLIRALRVRLADPAASVELLSVARKALADSGMAPETVVTRGQMRKLQALYLGALLHAFTDPANPPSASLLSECGAALRSHGIVVEETKQADRAARSLAGLVLPFMTR